MAIQGVVFFFLLLVIETSSMGEERARPTITAQSEDQDVLTEKQYIKSGAAKHDVLTLKNLSKVYSVSGGKKVTAVSDFFLSIRPGEVKHMAQFNITGGREN